MSTHHAPVREKFAHYIEGIHPDPESVVLEMERFAARNDVPVVSRDVGAFLYQLVGLHRPRRIVECGTAIGMSAIYMARALRDFDVRGRIDTLDVSEERHRQARDYLRRAVLVDLVRFHTEPALEFLRKDSEPLDLLFLDAVKEEYRGYVEAALPRMKKGSLVVADNLLWHGFVPGDRQPDTEFYRKSTEALRAFNKFLLSHPRLAARIYAIGDGTGVAVVR